MLRDWYILKVARLLTKKTAVRPSVVARAYNPSTMEAEAEGSKV